MQNRSNYKEKEDIINIIINVVKVEDIIKEDLEIINMEERITSKKG